MSLPKRLFDLALAVVLSFVLLPVMVALAVAIILFDGFPVFYVSERMKGTGEGFDLVKFRTMRSAISDHGVSGGDKSARITRTGSMLRAARLDEIPQLWNVLRGDMSFVGPRPPLRMYVNRFPGLYAEVLQCRPGITGLASLVFHAHEEKLLADCQSADESDAVYSRRCVPRKARLDLIYQRNQSCCMDIWIMLKTVSKRSS
ncbi:sugar transferase [Maritimibacter dapengensis]|uniref:Sugar transferase n=1 Tax=Maritimibacter dapengensis TaxID=2836868 RepID=A0ABS6T626_9RHOB|nr:sugar transferase [Maritimibacter dapengensis]MBV7380721.1 sugar transferase [Maritimibacter dapengensis]